jgi:hypothetical protein
VANVVPKTFILKKEKLVSSSHFPSSTFIDINDSSNEDVCLFVNFDVNFSSSFPALVLDVYHMEDVSSNLN